MEEQQDQPQAAAPEGAAPQFPAPETHQVDGEGPEARAEEPAGDQPRAEPFDHPVAQHEHRPEPQEAVLELTDMAAENAARDEQDRREEGRVPVHHETEIRCLGERYRGTILDLSRWGVMAQCDHEMSVRSYVYVVLPGVGGLPARVTWASGGRFGANLLEPISDEHFERLVKILPGAPADQAA